MELRPGVLIAGRFRVERKVGSGGMGEVWSGEQTALGVRVALKTLLPAAACDPQLIARFKREAYLLGRIRSDHVARVVDFVTDPEVGLVLVMEFVEGEPLSSAVASRRLGVEETIDLGLDLASGLCDLHRAHVVHRDLKPENIILQPQSDGRVRAIIVDFGVGRTVSSEEASARDEEITGITHAGMAVGTIAYMAPEQLLDSRGATGAADIYALGAILYRAASGQQVFGPLDDLDYAKKKLIAPPTALDLPRFDRAARGLQAVVARALAKNPTGRYATAEAMRQELLALRDVARSLAMDLDAPTDMAPLSALLSDDVRRASRPSDEPTLVDDVDEEATQSDLPATSPTVLEEPATLNTAVALVASPVASTASTLATGSPSPPFPAAPETTRTLSPASARRGQITLALGILGGALVGFLVHWAFAAALSTP
jgi:serine/threonine-protein kinase